MKWELVLRRKDLLNTYRCIPCHVLLLSDKAQIKSINRNKKKFPFNSATKIVPILLFWATILFVGFYLRFAATSVDKVIEKNNIYWFYRLQTRWKIWWIRGKSKNKFFTSYFARDNCSNYDVFSHWPKQLISSQIATITCTILIY